MLDRLLVLAHAPYSTLWLLTAVAAAVGAVGLVRGEVSLWDAVEPPLLLATITRLWATCAPRRSAEGGASGYAVARRVQR